MLCIAGRGTGSEKRRLLPAMLSCEGIPYLYLAPRVMDDASLEYLQSHLRILSGFYGILKPFDGVVPQRLEMQAKPRKEKPVSLYEYWGNTLAEHLFREDHLIVNLASKEYSRCILKYGKNRPDIRCVTCVFGEAADGRIVEKGTPARMARGEMTCCLAENQADDPDTFVFVKIITIREGHTELGGL